MVDLRPRLSPAQIDDIKARANLAHVAADLGAALRPSGRKLVGSCPMCGGGKRASRFEVIGEGWVCAVCSDGGDVIKLLRLATGCDFMQAVERLGGSRVLSDAEAAKLEAKRAAVEAKRAGEQERYRLKEIAACRTIWDSAALSGLGGVETYFAARGCRLPATAALRCVASLPYWHGSDEDETGRSVPRIIHRGPAMIAAMVDNFGEFAGVHITYLAADFAGKAEIFDPETGEQLVAKKVRGSKTGAHIVVRSGGVSPRRLFMGEGIETVATVATALAGLRKLGPGDAFWSSCDLGNLGGPHLGTIDHPTAKSPKGRAQRLPGPVPDMTGRAIALPESVTHVVLLGDGDSEPVLTETTLERARRRYSGTGVTVAVAMAPAGCDFNDLGRA